MANIYSLITFISKWEGGFVNDPSDPGGPTNKGITLKTWKKKGYDKNDDGELDLSDLKMVTHQDMVEVILRPHYWDPWQGDRIHDQSVANIIVDWAWCSGRKTVPFVQWILKIKPDGIVGPLTIKALNHYPNQEELFTMIKAERALNIRNLCKKRPELNRFKSGWLNRIADFKYLPLLLMCCVLLGFTNCRSLPARPSELVLNTQQALNLQQEVATDGHFQAIDHANSTHQVYTTDSIEETMQVAFSVPMQAQVQAMQERILAMQSHTLPIIVPVMMHGVATLRRIRKTQQADTSTTNSTLAKAKQQSASQLHQFYTNDSLTYTRQTKDRRVLITHKLISLSLFMIGISIATYFFFKIQRWKSD